MTELPSNLGPTCKAITSEEYKDSFGLDHIQGRHTDVEKALDLALDIRKFEIELYWKRATYFWAFIAVALGGYVALLNAKDIQTSDKSDALLTASCIGVVFSIAWYFVNRASKFWQENWEKHVDLLEDRIVGPLYKTVLSDSKIRFWRMWSAYPFSVCKLNQILSAFIAILFFMLAAAT